MKFILDENISPKICDALAVFGLGVDHVRRRFGEGAKDPVWLPLLKSDNSVLITADEKIRFRPLERQALVESGATVFFLLPFFTKLNGIAKAGFLLTHWHEVMEEASKFPYGTHFRVYSGGKIEVWPDPNSVP